MALLSDQERDLAEKVSRLSYTNPFLPARVEAERAILGSEHSGEAPVWHARGGAGEDEAPDVLRIQERVVELVEELARRLREGAEATPEERRLYRDAVLYRLYNDYQERLLALVLQPERSRRQVPFYRGFVRDAESALEPVGGTEEALRPPHLFAIFFQLRRAFHFVFHGLLGGSLPAARLRAAVWESIFTHDLRRYRRSLYHRMGDLTTLITGPSGTGKELVARAIGLSRYIPFEEGAGKFNEEFEESFFSLNLSALSPTLIESELFGHRRGAFTGALENRVGWFETCPPLGTVFLDEIGEVAEAIQVKLLRVLQTRRFQRLGDTRDIEFEGKLVAATNRDPDAEMRAGRMREDFYYRLCSDLVTTPSLAEQLADDPGQLEHLALFLARRIAGDESAEALTSEVVAWCGEHLPADYAWPGNVRELEQCVRNVMVRGSYQPRGPEGSADPAGRLGRAVAGAELELGELERRYVALVYERVGSYSGAARRLGIDRRTVKARVEAAEGAGPGGRVADSVESVESGG